MDYVDEQAFKLLDLRRTCHREGFFVGVIFTVGLITVSRRYREHMRTCHSNH